MAILRRLVEQPYVNLAAAIILFVTGLTEGWDSFQEDMAGFHLRAHHGVMIYGFFNMLKPLPDIFEGLDKMNHKSLEAK